MRWIVRAVISLLSFSTSFAQLPQSSIQWMPAEATKATHFFAGKKDDGFQVFSVNDSGHLVIQQYNLSSQLVATQNGIVPDRKGNMFLLLPSNNGWVGFWQEKNNKEHAVQAVHINKDASISSHKSLEPALTGNKFSDLNFVSSAKQSHILVYTGIYNNKENRNEWNFAVYSIAKGEWVNRAVYYNSFTTAILESVQVDEEGRAFFISKQYKNMKDAMKVRNAWHSIDVFENGAILAQHNFSQVGYEIAGVDMISDPQGTLYLTGTGFPVETDKAGLLEGRRLFLYQFNKGGTSFTDSLFIPMEKLYGVATINKEADIPVIVKKILFGAYGEKILVAEQQQKILSSAGSWFKSNDIFCVRLDAKGALLQATRIPRLQDSNGAATFMAGYWNKKLFLIGSDNKQNETATTEVKAFSPKASNNGLFLIQVNEDGSFIRKLLTGYEIPDTAPVYHRCIDMGGGLIFLSSNYQFAIVKVSR